MVTTPVEDLEQRISSAIGPKNQDALPGILTRLRSIVQESYRNDVTGAPGPRQLDSDLRIVLERAPREDQDVYVVMLDIDDFGDFNKIYGEETGNQVLKSVTKIIGETLREDDIVLRVSKNGADYHLHGEEMLALYVCDNLDDAVNVSERIVSQVANKTEEEMGYKVTVSAGVTKLCIDREEFTEAKARADRYMQFAKIQGKNKTYTADEGRDPLFALKDRFFYRSGIVDNLARKVPKAVKLAKGIIGSTATDLANRALDTNLARIAANYIK
jgi:diguanylate cyclase (GGDEF)-like protein